MPRKRRKSRKYPSPTREGRWRVRKCCFRATLRVGAFIVALIYVVVGVIEGILYLYAGSFSTAENSNTTSAKIITYTSWKVTLSQKERHLMLAFGGIFLGVLLFFAILEETIFLLVVWLWLDLAAIIQYFVLAGLVFAIKEVTRSILGGILELLFVIIIAAIAIYGYLIVYSYYRYISGKDDEEDAIRRVGSVDFFETA